MSILQVSTSDRLVKGELFLVNVAWEMWDLPVEESSLSTSGTFRSPPKIKLRFPNVSRCAVTEDRKVS